MTQLRMSLPPLATLTSDSLVDFAWLDRSGQVSDEGKATLKQLGASAKAVAVQCYLHPQDSVVTSMELPLLPTAKVTAAVGCAAQAFILGSSEHMFIAHSARDSQGCVQIAWAPRAALQRFGQLLRESHLKLLGLYPAAFALPVKANAMVVSLHDEHLLVRHSPHCATVHPAADEALNDLLATGAVLHWVGEGGPATVLETMPAAQRWCGAAPGWGLHDGVQITRVAQGGWGRAVGACALALLVWIVGLNIYAAREAAVGQGLKAGLTQRVKQAFPELPVILNPLQQARQQLAARQSGAAQDSTQLFNHLLQQAGNAMPFLSGRVQTLEFADGEMHLTLSPDSRKVTDDTWQATLAQAGIAVTASTDGWTLRPVSAAQEDPKAVADTHDE
ncbi:type II secretion system protein GspL [Pseudomonas syringae]|nr:type II secretion system protein GspL [Pseudomonas syringae]MCQ3001078.1 type II secretion system protein GspL [Pseudomonas syringae]MCQ3031110.1 type II secretion system protein GspL [Pseudomonas syringae]MDG6398964.1 type II secretion system protein GspL [Pseudomonas quasicaspiana]